MDKPAEKENLNPVSSQSQAEQREEATKDVAKDLTKDASKSTKESGKIGIAAAEPNTEEQKQAETSKPNEAGKKEPKKKEEDEKEPRQLIVVGSDSGSGKLQKRFEKFRKLRMHQIKVQKDLDIMTKLDRSSTEFRERLRQKFVDTAHKYIGVPYDKRFHKPGSALRRAKLFLDCCALIRQIVYDLREDFGFVLQRYNQSYQMDTLPIVLTLPEMRPGDLIFYSGTYLDKRCKRQKHDLVHVEVFLGGETGEESIGARWFDGVVTHFKSFKFKSTMYNNVVHHFRSLETWLQGVCKNCCPEHEWNDLDTNWSVSKHSIFSDYQAAADPQLEDVFEAQPTS